MLRLSAPGILALLLVLAPETAHARCAAESLELLPAGDTIPANGQLILTAYGQALPTARSISSRRPRLVARGDTVALHVVAEHEGASSMYQVVLAPERALREGISYRFVTDGRRLRFWDREGPVRFRAVESNTTPPQWSQAPAVVDSSYVHYGCGPAAYAHVATPLKGAALVRATVTHVASGASRTFVLPIEAGQIKVGHGMCGGEFNLVPGQAYRARLDAIGPAGRVAPAPGPALELIGPSPSP